MKQFVIIILFLASAFVTFAQENACCTAEQKKLIDLSVELMNAVERKDQATLERLVAEDFFVAIPGDLTEVKRNEWIANSVP